ncbi:hypothetical protein L1987_65454 [Smallanthus sonchifolius]|uniref:Uncharacterized protein n=1 Tax=Smallanthus sonchifolius TaxID=185202 RepID=A0ACB9BUR1_9ASTR|nr:hypothetical protein L1987_65454 [Smallanthus sonchifolius]
MVLPHPYPFPLFDIKTLISLIDTKTKSINKMADIAMLMAEEYEKMMMKKKKMSNDNVELESTTGVWIKKPRFKKLVHEPKSKIGRATINGFFSP